MAARYLIGGVRDQIVGSGIHFTSAGAVMPSFSSTPLIKVSNAAAVGIPSTWAQ